MAITDDIKLTVYNGALRHLGSRRIASLTENREPRRVLDDVWNNGRVVNEALERGDWNFAIRSIKAEYEPDITTQFGFRRAFRKPDDFKRMSSMSASEFHTPPLTNDEYITEGAYWLSNHNTLYVRFVSNRDDYGFDSSLWTSGFTSYIEARMAFDACERITNSRAKRADAMQIMEDALKEAKAVDGFDDGPKMRPHGSWVRSRRGGVPQDRVRG